MSIRSYPIYLNLSDEDNRNRDKGFGARDSLSIDVNVGSSRANSQLLASIRVVKSDADFDKQVFELYVDGKKIKDVLFDPVTKEFN